LCGIYSAGIVDVLQRLGDRIAFLDFWHVLGVGFVRPGNEATRCRYCGQLDKLASGDFTQVSLLTITLWYFVVAYINAN
jgi:hypothetical protein